MDEQTGESEEEEVMGEGIGESEMEELVQAYQNEVDEEIEGVARRRTGSCCGFCRTC